MSRHVHVYLGMDAFLAEGERLFGKDKTNWEFQCTTCGAVNQVCENKGDDPIWCVFETATICDGCGAHLIKTGKINPPRTRPYSARLLYHSDNQDIDEPIFDFYRGNDPDFATSEEVEA